MIRHPPIFSPLYSSAASDVYKRQVVSTPVGVDTTYPNGLNAKTPYLSPSFGDYAGFPPMLLQAGDLEVLLSDSQMVYDNAIAHGVDCTLTVYPGMFHVFQGSLDLLPESRAAWEEVGAFLARVMGE